ncbi:MAG: hypothetical protein IMW99_03660 [Firmicutes bacterium]|nr:hypothetical protein [Bacillota bacterium]
MPINGKKYSWEDITIKLPHGTLIDVDSIEYGDKIEKEALYGKGSNAQGYGLGNYSAEGKLSLRREEFEKLIAHAKQNGGSLYGLKPFTITVAYAKDGDQTTMDTLKSCSFTETSSSSKQGDKEVKVDLSFLILDGIKWNDLDANPEKK